MKRERKETEVHLEIRGVWITGDVGVCRERNKGRVRGSAEMKDEPESGTQAGNGEQ